MFIGGDYEAHPPHTGRKMSLKVQVCVTASGITTDYQLFLPLWVLQACILGIILLYTDLK